MGKRINRHPVKGTEKGVWLVNGERSHMTFLWDSNNFLLGGEGMILNWEQSLSWIRSLSYSFPLSSWAVSLHRQPQTLFQSRQGWRTVDVYWLSDDGGRDSLAP